MVERVAEVSIIPSPNVARFRAEGRWASNERTRGSSSWATRSSQAPGFWSKSAAIVHRARALIQARGWRTRRCRLSEASKGEERALRGLGSGDHLGELAILREQPRSATAVAEEQPVRVLALGGQALTSILEERPAVSLAMLSSLAERLSTLA